VAAALPFIRAVATSHAAFSRSTISLLLGNRLAETRHVEAVILASVALLHRGDHLELQPLPAETQWAPVFAVVPADFNGDAHQDVFLCQNFFAVHGEAPRQDASRGLLLIGDGTGRLRPLPGQESGILIYGEQRGAATADFDADGRSDLVVGQNAAATRLFRNRGARPGLRVRVAGPAGNPSGVGARVRLASSEGLGPVHIVDGGSGWLSQNSPILVLGVSGTPLEIQVRWPGGAFTRTAVPAAVTEVVATP
jgi:hypothetical protein